jgi:KTSC domain
MNRQAVSSSNVASVGYDPQSNTLEVGFLSGGVYQYYGVPSGIFRGLVGASSVGSYLHHHVKGIFRYRRVR